jgi:selenocysteine lyase/cysteine desulfurase
MDIRARLAELVGLGNIELTNSANSAIFAALHLCRLRGKKKVLIPHEGGWFSYKHYPAILGLHAEEIKTDYALLDLEHIKRRLDSESCVLFATLGAYAVLEPIAQIAALAHRAGALVIGDISGTAGMPGVDHSKLDYAVCSFGQHKPIEAGFGGLLLSSLSLDTPVLSMARFPDDRLPALQNALDTLEARYALIKKKRGELIPVLQGMAELAHPAKQGLNLLVKGHSGEVIRFCRAKGLAFVLCPKYHRVMEKAVSVELKRLKA